MKSLEQGKWQQAGIKKGFILLYIDKEPIDTLEKLDTFLKNKKDGILVEGIYPNNSKKRVYYGLGW